MRLLPLLRGTIKPFKEQFSQRNPHLLSLPPSIEITIPCEKALIQHLMTVGRRAAKVGSSRHSCVSCMRWMERLNEETQVPNPWWVIQETKERILCQPSECTPEMQDTIFDHLIGVVIETKAQIRKIWRHENNFRRWMSEWDGDDEALIAEVFNGIEDRFPRLGDELEETEKAESISPKEPSEIHGYSTDLEQAG
jgi:hypothetical protein